jgi:transposase
MKNIVRIDEISKEELYKLYLKEVEKNEKIEAAFKALQIKNQVNLQTIINLLEDSKIKRAKQFVPKSETNIVDNVFNEAEVEIKEEKKKEKVKSGRPKGSKNFDVEYFEKHHEEEIVLRPDELKEQSNLVHIGNDVTYKVEYTAPKCKIIKIISEKYINKESNRIYQKINANDPYPHSICTPSLASNIITNKFILGLPYYRQEHYLFNNEVEISRQNLCNYQIRTSDLLKPFYLYLKELLIQNQVKIIHADETTLNVLEVNSKSQCYVWLYTSSFYDYPIYIYEYQRTRSSHNPKQFLKDYNGWVVTDAYEGYNNIPNVNNSYCWVHARRNFTDILKSLSENQRNESKSYDIVKKMDKLFEYERKFREQKYTASKILQLRNDGEYKETVDSLFNVLESSTPEKGSALEKAIKYIISRKDKFLNILKDGHLDLSNNISERAIKPFVIARKNFLFSNTEIGADSSTILFSIIQTARANGLDAVKYLEYLIKNISSSNNNFENLLPWKLGNNFKLK